MSTEQTRHLTHGHDLLDIAIQKAGGQAALARKVGVTRSAVHFWTQGSVPGTAPVLARLARYGIPLSAWEKPSERTAA